MANEKLLQTRISLKYDTYANWTDTSKTDAGANLVLKKGEVGFCEIPTGNAEATTAPTVLFKVGTYDGQNDSTKIAFKDLKWASALAADVHAWAKKSEAEFLAWVKGLVPIEVIDPTPTNGKFITKVEATSDANGHHITITRSDVDWNDVKNKPNLVNSVKTTDDDVVVLTPETAASGDVTITGAHAKKGPSAGYTGSTNIKGGTAVVGTELDIKVPVLTVDAYGHTNAVNEASYKITIPKATAPNDGELTLKASNGLTPTEKVFTANDPNNVTFEVSHADTSDAANLVADGRKYVTGLTFDDFGHVTGYTTGTESDQDLSGYKVLQEAYTKEATGAFEVVSKIEQNANGEVTVGTKTLDLSGYQEKGNYKTVQEAVDDKGLTGANVLGSLSQDTNGVITYTTRTLTAADLGLDTVMHFIGAFETAPTKAFAGTADERNLANGDVYLNTANATEYVYSGGEWVELGNESAAGSHALKTISITGTGYLTGGGTLEANRTIDIDGSVKTKIDHGETAHGWGDHSKEGYLKNGDIAGKADKVDNATEGNFAGLDANGNLTDSGKKADDFATKAQGDKADTAVQDVEFNVSPLYDYDSAIKIGGAEVSLGTDSGKSTRFYVVGKDHVIVEPDEDEEAEQQFVVVKTDITEATDAKAGLVTLGAEGGAATYTDWKATDDYARGYSIAQGVADIDGHKNVAWFDLNNHLEIGSIIRENYIVPGVGFKFTAIKVDSNEQAPRLDIDDTITWIFNCGGAGV